MATNLASVKKNLGSEGSQYQSLVNKSSHGERKQGRQALNGPSGPIQCLQMGERKLS